MARDWHWALKVRKPADGMHSRYKVFMPHPVHTYLIYPSHVVAALVDIVVRHEQIDLVAVNRESQFQTVTSLKLNISSHQSCQY